MDFSAITRTMTTLMFTRGAARTWTYGALAFVAFMAAWFALAWAMLQWAVAPGDAASVERLVGTQIALVVAGSLVAAYLTAVLVRGMLGRHLTPGEGKRFGRRMGAATAIVALVFATIGAAGLVPTAGLAAEVALGDADATGQLVTETRVVSEFPGSETSTTTTTWKLSPRGVEMIALTLLAALLLAVPAARLAPAAGFASLGTPQAVRVVWRSLGGRSLRWAIAHVLAAATIVVPLLLLSIAAEQLATGGRAMELLGLVVGVGAGIFMFVSVATLMAASALELMAPRARNRNRNEPRRLRAAA